MLPNSRFQPSASYRPPATAPQPLVSSREWPTLTLYRDGLANLNALATELLRQADSVALVAPPATKPGRLGKAWQLHADPTTDALPLIPHGARVSSRFRALTAALLLFAGQPPQVRVLSFVLTPEPGHADRFRLLPV